MRAYENLLIVSERCAQEQVDAITEKATEVLKSAGAEVAETRPWGRRRLAYPIERNQHGHYVILKFASDGAAVAELESALRLEDDVLRFQTVHDPGEFSDDAPVHYRNIDFLVQFITDRGKIRPARATKLPARKQRHLGKAIKQARMVALLPFSTVSNL